MRPKLVVGVSSLAALLGAGSCIGVVFFVFSSFSPVTRPGLIVASTFLLPIALIGFASVFVYRHTARRRRLQAFATAVLATVLTLALLAIAIIVSGRRNMPTQPVLTPNRSGN